MLGTLQQIGESGQTSFNAGYLTHLYLIRTDDVVYVDSVLPDTLNLSATSIGIKVGATISQFMIRPKTASFSESSADSFDGTAYSMSLTFPMKASDELIASWRHQNSKRRFVILCRDTLGNCYLAGSPQNGARVSWSRQVAATNFHQITLNLVDWHPMTYLPTIDLDQIFADREFDYSFDLSFS